MSTSVCLTVTELIWIPRLQIVCQALLWSALLCCHLTVIAESQWYLTLALFGRSLEEDHICDGWIMKTVWGKLAQTIQSHPAVAADFSFRASALRNIRFFCMSFHICRRSQQQWWLPIFNTTGGKQQYSRLKQFYLKTLDDLHCTLRWQRLIYVKALVPFNSRGAKCID